MEKVFHVLAGRLEYYRDVPDENIEFADVFDSIEAAEQCVIEKQLTSYPICYIKVSFIK
ncbi:hypothetical protein [Photorhabdus temperata]|uniref:Uncharacterized protein n=1 Tax=Photorhabdus temperata J3 TaxID=1389415 RepID=U7QUW1_PHOTE|nr:hypothetical protein [Photorhabdus temperata]ERT11052.1 hypothetical protein O185_21495 [Photorhabdus temperata J3]